MFADSLLDNHWDNRSHRGWTTTLASFALEALCVGIVLLLPLLYTEGLPQLQLMGTIAFGSAIPIDSNPRTGAQVGRRRSRPSPRITISCVVPRSGDAPKFERVRIREKGCLDSGQCLTSEGS
jgi:hypothetical protein